MNSNSHPDVKPLSADRAAQLMRLATYASVSVAAVLIVAKFVAWMMTDSVSLMSTLLDSLLDAAASLVNLFAVRHALQPADAEHRFGHGKAEPLAGLAQAAFIMGSGLFLLIEAGHRLISPRAIENSDIGMMVMVFAIVLTVFLVAFQRYVVKKTGSVAIRADSAHYQMDVLVNASVILSLFLSAGMGWTLADPLFAIAIAAYIAYGAWSIGMDSLHHLMDRELPDEDRDKIKGLALSEEGVIDMHDLRTRQSGTQVFIQLHLEMSPEIPLLDAHIISEAVMGKIEAAFPHAEVLIHEDPAGVDEHRSDFEQS